MKRLDCKVCLVTGSASAIGRATCLRPAKEGASVTIVDIEDADGEKLREEIVARGDTADYRHLDITDEAAVQEVFGVVVDRLGRIDLVVNNAGIAGPTSPPTRSAPRNVAG